MGHCCGILTFKGDTPKWKIQAAVDDWFYENCGPREGGAPDGVNWDRSDMMFNGYEAARDYLNDTFGHYDQYAVKFHPEAKNKPSTAVKRLTERRDRDMIKLAKACLTAYHYLEGISSKYVTCKDCGSKLNREVMTGRIKDWDEERFMNVVKMRLGYMEGSSRYTMRDALDDVLRMNSCPVCGHCILPKTTVDSLESKADKLTELVREIDKVKSGGKKFDESKFEWAVAAECHC